MVARMSSVQLMKLTTHLILTLAPDFFSVLFFSLAIGALCYGSLLRTAADFIDGLGAHLGDVRGVFQTEQRCEGSLDDVVGIRGAQRLGEHIVNSRDLHDFAHGAAGDHAGTFGSRL